MKIIEIIGTIIVMIGVILIYEARHISKKSFSISDQNIVTFGFKLLGFTSSIVGGVLILVA